VAAFEPEVGESAGALQSKNPPANHSVVPAGGGFLQVSRRRFPEDFAADVAKRLQISCYLPSANLVRDL